MAVLKSYLSLKEHGAVVEMGVDKIKTNVHHKNHVNHVEVLWKDMKCMHLYTYGFTTCFVRCIMIYIETRLACLLVCRLSKEDPRPSFDGIVHRKGNSCHLGGDDTRLGI